MGTRHKAATKPLIHQKVEMVMDEYGAALALQLYGSAEEAPQRTSFSLGYLGVFYEVGDALLRGAEEKMDRISLGDPFRAGVAAARQHRS